MITVALKTISGNIDKGTILFKQIDEAAPIPNVVIEMDGKRAGVNTIDLIRAVAALTGIKIEQT